MENTITQKTAAISELPEGYQHQWFCQGKEPCACMDSWKAGGWKDDEWRLNDSINRSNADLLASSADWRESYYAWRYEKEEERTAEREREQAANWSAVSKAIVKFQVDLMGQGVTGDLLTTLIVEYAKARFSQDC